MEQIILKKKKYTKLLFKLKIRVCNQKICKNNITVNQIKRKLNQFKIAL